MASIVPGYEYDIFISYRQKDNKGDRWVSEFVDALKTELESTFKEEISVYFDINTHDGLLETHDVNASLKEKLKCLVFIPIISQTYCDSKSFAWQHEFVAFNQIAKEDHFGRDIRLAGGNVASRILPVKINDLDQEDKMLLENELGGILRSIDFIYKASGVNRPLKPNDERTENLNHTYYRDQINKVANAVKEIITAIKKYNQQDGEISKEVVKSEHDHSKKLKPKIIIPSVIVLALIVLGYFFIPKLFESSEPVEKSIAVLPFKLLSDEPNKQYLADGMMEAIHLNLSKIKDLRVMPSTSVEQFRVTTKTTRQIGKELGVEYLLEGRFQKDGNNVKVIVDLIKASKESQAWAKDYNRNWNDVFSVQSEVAQTIARELHAVITPEEKQLIEKKPTANLKAYEFFIRAQQLADNYWRDNDTRNLPEAQRLLDKALEIDPGYEMAIEAKGDVFLAQSKYDSVLVYANRLTGLNPYSARGYFLKGEYYNFTNVPDSAIKNYLFALKFQNKNEISDKEWCEFQIGWVYCMGKNDYQKGLQYLEKGWDVKEKGDWVRPFMVGHIFLSIGDYEKSNKYYQKSLEIDESPLCIASYSMSLVVQSRSEEALSILDTICKEPQSKVICNQRRFYTHLTRKEFDLAEQFYMDFLNAGGTPDVNDSIWLSYLYKKTGKEQAAITLLKRCKTSLENQTVKNSNFELYLKLSCIYAILENKEEALKNLTKSVDIGLQFGWQDFLEICPLFENLWDDPDFKAIVHRAQNEIATIRAQVKKMEQSGETNL